MRLAHRTPFQGTSALARIGADGVAHLLDRPAKLPLSKERGAADKGIRPCSGALNRSLLVDPAIDFNSVAEISLAAPVRSLLDLGQHLVDERLSSKTGIHRHDQQKVDLV